MISVFVLVFMAVVDYNHCDESIRELTNAAVLVSVK